MQRQFSDEDLATASLFLLDALSSAYAGSGTTVGRKLINWSKADAHNTRSNAFLMGALTHITETDDLHRASVTHPGCVVIPAVLSIAQTTGASGRDILVATLRGFEAMCRIGRAVGPAHYKLWHNTATCGPFGSAFATASLLQLDENQTVSALGNAGTQSSGLWQFLSSGTMSKHLHAGRASESGLLAAELAQHNFTGAPDILEGEQGMFIAMCPDADPGRMQIPADAAWELSQTSIKPWPSCRHTHPAIDAALEIHAQLGNAIVEKVDIFTYESGQALCDRVKPKNEYQAKFSLQHCVSHALLRGEVTLTSFSDEACVTTAELCSKSNVFLSESLSVAYPKAWGAKVSVSTADGRQLDVERAHCKGDPELPVTQKQWLEKSKALLEYGGLDSVSANDLIAEVLELPARSAPVTHMNEFIQHVST